MHFCTILLALLQKFFCLDIDTVTCPSEDSNKFAPICLEFWMVLPPKTCITAAASVYPCDVADLSRIHLLTLL
jgi:hypothetical protein